MSKGQRTNIVLDVVLLFLIFDVVLLVLFMEFENFWMAGAMAVVIVFAFVGLFYILVKIVDGVIGKKH